VRRQPDHDRSLDAGHGVGDTEWMNRIHAHRRAVFAASAMAAVTALVGVTGCRAGTPVALTSAPPAATATSAAPADTPAPATTAPPTAAPATTAPATAATAPAAAGPLRMGSSGPAVLRLQQRLSTLGYWLGTLDGDFGGQTQQAVFALQKAAGLSPSGTVTAATQRALDAGVRPTAKSTSGRVIEVNLSRNLLLFVNGGHVTYTLNTSTGGGYVYYDQGEREVATTPKGHFTTYRVIDGPHRSSLGLLIRPRYFTAGYAIHGDSSVPAKPVSHGCVRVTDAAIDWIWAANLDPIGTPVWIY
jgi:peptidoglycan hydrolase-like protein with peptidoglycan-binding domain